MGVTKPTATPRSEDPTDQRASCIRAAQERRSFAARIRALILLLLLGAIQPAPCAPQEPETKNLVADDSGAGEAALAEAVTALGAKHALIIGNHDYANPVWGKLETVPGELDELGKALTAAGFTLYKGKIHYNLKLLDLESLMRGFVTQFGVGRSTKDDQLLIFFSGHGESVQGRGYIVPVDAPGTSPDEDAFVKGALPFSEIEAMAKRTDARHLLFAFDSCFAGDLFDFRSGDGPPLPLPLAVAKIAAGKSRQFMTAGRAGEKVPARSQFTPFFTRGLRGDADADRNGYVTATELFAFLQPKVAEVTKTTPRFAGLPGAEYEGDFVFRAPQPVAKPQPVAIANLNELFQGSDLASAAPEQQGKMVKEVQAALFRAQLYNGGLDGIMGPLMVEAVRTWQRQHNLPDSGRLDAATLATFSSRAETEVTAGTATKENPFINTLGIPLVPLPVTKVLFAAWETRVSDYITFAEETKRPWERPGFPQTNTHPVVNVTYDDAVEFCRWLSVREGLTYRLPTENEWILTTGAVAGRLPLYPWGNAFPPFPKTANIADRAAWNVTKAYLPEYEDGFAQTAPVGRMSANVHGISDLGGNVWEWCTDPSPEGPGENPERCCKGGSWQDSDQETLRSTFQRKTKSDERHDTIGFRIVLEVPPPPPAKEDALAKEVALRMLKLAASYADLGAGREKTPNLVSSFLDLFGLPLKDEEGTMLGYGSAGVSYVACRAYIELQAEPDKPIEMETMRAAIPKVRDLLFSPSPSIQVMMGDAQKRETWGRTQDEVPKPGWLAVFSWDGNRPRQIGIVESFQEGQLTTIEFNTAPDAATTRDGGVVARKMRDLRYVIGYIKTY